MPICYRFNLSQGKLKTADNSVYLERFNGGTNIILLLCSLTLTVTWHIHQRCNKYKRPYTIYVHWLYWQIILDLIGFQIKIMCNNIKCRSKHSKMGCQNFIVRGGANKNHVIIKNTTPMYYIIFCTLMPVVTFIVSLGYLLWQIPKKVKK